MNSPTEHHNAKKGDCVPISPTSANAQLSQLSGTSKLPQSRNGKQNLKIRARFAVQHSDFTGTEKETDEYSAMYDDLIETPVSAP